MNPVVTNKKGGVISKYTWDGIHLKAEYYDLWVDFLNQHGLPNEMFQAYQKEQERKRLPKSKIIKRGYAVRYRKNPQSVKKGSRHNETEIIIPL